MIKRTLQSGAVLVLIASLAGCCCSSACVDPCAPPPCGGCCPPSPCLRFDPYCVANSVAGAVCGLRGSLCSLFCSDCGGCGYGYGGGHAHGDCCCPDPCCGVHGVPGGYGPPVGVPPYGPVPGTPLGSCPYCQPPVLPASIPVETAPVPIPQVPPAKDISSRPSQATGYLPTSVQQPAVAPAAYQQYHPAPPYHARSYPWTPQQL